MSRTLLGFLEGLTQLDLQVNLFTMVGVFFNLSHAVKVTKEIFKYKLLIGSYYYAIFLYFFSRHLKVLNISATR